MRVLVDLNDSDLRELDRLAKGKKRSRASIVREAISDHLRAQAHSTGDSAFGLWKGRGIDGLAYQEKIRSEW